MKKALAILLALSMVFAAFADEPATNYSVAEFKGEASLEYVYDLDNEASGFVNSESATLKLNLLNGGNKATTGDGIWGELEIKIDTPDAAEFTKTERKNNLSINKNTSVEKAKIHFVEGDFGVALNLKAPGLGIGEVSLPTAVGAGAKTSEGLYKTSKYDVSAAFNPANAKIEAAEKDVKDAEDALALAKAKAAAGLAVANDVKDAEDALTAKKDALAAAKAGNLTAGFAVEFTSSKVDATIKVLDNGVQKDKEYGFGADVSVKAIENAGLKAAFAYAYETTAFGVSADYKYAIDEKLYVKPAVAFKMMDETKDLAGSVLFGWGAEDQEPNFIVNKYGFDGENFDGKDADNNDIRFIQNKCADGVSVGFSSDLDEENGIVIGLYDGSLVEGLKVGAEYRADLDALDDGMLNFAAKYNKDIDIITIGLDFGLFSFVGMDDAATYAYQVEVSTDDVIDNTTVYAKYTDGRKVGTTTEKGKITVGAKIAF